MWTPRVNELIEEGNAFEADVVQGVTGRKLTKKKSTPVRCRRTMSPANIWTKTRPSR
jgi:hypothetical protein